MKNRYRFLGVTVLVLATLVFGFASYVVWVRPAGGIGIADDLDDVDLDEVMMFAERANAAYHEERDFRREYGDHIAIGEFPESGLRVYIDANPNGGKQWVMLRGTANLPNVFDDLEFVGRDEHELGIHVHAGFDSSLQDCLPWVLERLDSARPVRVTGHSLGGAVAVLLVAVLDRRGFEDVSAVTFGQPKFTDSHGAERLGYLDILRVVHDEDPVPMVPPTMLRGKEISAYVHLGPEVIVRADGHFYFLPEHAADRRNIANYWEEMSNIQPIRHDMIQGYLPALKRAMESSRTAE